MRRLLAILITVTMLAGCSINQTTWGPPVALDRETVTGSNATQAQKSVGVVSLLGRSFRMQKVGMTVFGNELEIAQIAAWDVDAHATRSLATALSGKAEAKRVAHRPAAFDAMFSGGGMFRSLHSELEEALRRATAGQSHDLYIVLLPVGSQFGDTNQTIGGLGIVQASSLFASKSWVHTLFNMYVLDGRTHSILGWKQATVGQTRFLATIKGPHREIDASWWPPSSDKVAGDARLKGAVFELVQQAIATTLPEALALGPAAGAQRRPDPSTGSGTTATAVAH